MENYYVSNEDLLKAITEYQKGLHESVENGTEEPQMSNYIGECIIKIASKFAYRNNFINYSYRDEMISDGIEACVTGVKKFDTAYSNPFAYLTQCCFYAFISRIKREKTQQYVRSEMIKNFGIETFNIQDQDLDEDFRMSFEEFMNSNMNIDGAFLNKKKKPTVKKVGPLEDFMEEDTVNV
jgi:hypothetical protein